MCRRASNSERVDAVLHSLESHERHTTLGYINTAHLRTVRRAVKLNKLYRTMTCFRILAAVFICMFCRLAFLYFQVQCSIQFGQ